MSQTLYRYTRFEGRFAPTPARLTALCRCPECGSVSIPRGSRGGHVRSCFACDDFPSDPSYRAWRSGLPVVTIYACDLDASEQYDQMPAEDFDAKLSRTPGLYRSLAICRREPGKRPKWRGVTAPISPCSHLSYVSSVSNDTAIVRDVDNLRGGITIEVPLVNMGVSAADLCPPGHGVPSPRFALDDIVEGGEPGTQDWDRGTVMQINPDGSYLVAWDGGAIVAPDDGDGLRPYGGVDHWEQSDE